MIDWISDTLSQECINLQSLVNCLMHRIQYSQYAVKQGHYLVALLFTHLMSLDRTSALHNELR